MKLFKLEIILSALLIMLFVSCEEPGVEPEEETPYLLKQEDITIVDAPLSGSYSIKAGQLLRIEVVSVPDETGICYSWSLDDTEIAQTKSLEYMIESIGEHELVLSVSQGDLQFDYQFVVIVIADEIPTTPDGSSPYIETVFEYLPAPGQFVNKLPTYEQGDSSEDMCEKARLALADNAQQMITLGSYGGYITVGFDHTIENKEGLCDFRIKANAFQAEANPDEDNLPGGSCEPGIIMVSVDINGNGQPDDAWYEIEGSAHKGSTEELWYQKALENGNDVNYYYQNFEMTYYRPTDEPSADDYETYIAWTDNKDNSGYLSKNIYHSQCYYPLWVTDNELTFTGTRLPQNAIDESGVGNYFVLYKFGWGYADNDANLDDGSAVDISCAMDAKGNRVHLNGVDFIKVYTGVNQVNGWLGECSTEILGIDDLHLLGESVQSQH